MSTRTIQINKVYTQLFDVLQDPSIRYVVVYGGRRSGKSWAIADILAYIAHNQPGHFICPIRKVGTSLKDSVYSNIRKSLLNFEIPFQENKTDKELRLLNGSRFRCFGLDDPEKLKSLEDASILWFEEVTESTENDFDSLDAGLSPQNFNAKIILSHNPVPLIIGELHWLQKRFLHVPHDISKLTKQDDFAVLKTWYKDNAFCPDATKRVLEKYKETNPQLYEMWALGNFTILEGIVFDNWDVVKEVPENIDLWGYGLDFGFSIDPAAVLKIWGNKEDIYIQGMIYKTNLTNEDLSNEMTNAKITDKDLIIADSAEPKSIEDLYRKGFRRIRGVKKRANYKEDMVNQLRSYRIHLIDGDINLQKEFSTFCWAKDKEGKQLPKLQDGNDHYIDAFIMFMHETKYRRRNTATIRL